MLLLSEEPKNFPNSETWKTQVPIVWDQGISGWAKITIQFLINLKDPFHFPNWKQFPLRPKAKQSLQPIISKFLQHALFVPTNSPCNTSILPVKKKDGTY